MADNTLGVAIIARNAEATIKECIQSFAPYVDQIVVVLAGKSTDKTARLAKKASSKVELYDFEWIDDFAAARNFSFSKFKTDWLFWMDSDDVVYQAENLKGLIEKAEPKVGAIWLPYHYAIDEFGNVHTLYIRERILKAEYGWIWRGRLHETISPLTPCKFVKTEDVIILHKHKGGEPRNERNFRILNIMYQENPEDKRVWLYLGHQNFAAQNWMEAAQWYLKFGTDNGAIAVERYQALCYCVKALRNMQDNQAIDTALMAIELFPNYKDAYLELAHSYLMIGDADKAIHWVMLSDKKDLIEEPPQIIFINPLEYTFNKYALLSECYMKKGDFTTALNYLREAYKIRPIPDVMQNIKYIDMLLTRNRVADSLKILAVHLLNNKELVKLKSLLESVPYWFRDLPDYKQLETGIKHYTANIVDKPEIAELEDNVALVNISNVVDIESLLDELDKYDKVTLIAPLPKEDSMQINTYSQTDLERLITSKDGRHILNLQREQTRIICEYDKKPPEGLRVRLFTGMGLEHWSPQTIREIGCGGSETALAWTAREFAKRDCYPILYGMDNQVWDGVVYREHSTYKPDSIPCDLFITSRVPQVFNDDIPAKQKWLWLHDIHVRDGLTPEIAERVDLIMTLSHWQAGHIKRVYPFLKDAEIIDMEENEVTYDDTWTGGCFFEDASISKVPPIAIIGNGIDIERFDITEERIPRRFIWCSSPDRGLEEVLNMWPLIKKALPDAELKIFYGWNYFDSTLFIPEQRSFKERIRKLIRQDGVEWCGRVGQEEIARELCKADIMLYPPPHQFRETYGIAFLEAQAAGVLCFYRENGALGETIGNRGIPLPMDMEPEQVVSRIVEVISNEKLCNSLREGAKKYARKRTWGRQAEKILELYRRLENAR